MEEEMLKQKYRDLRMKLKSFRNQISELMECQKDLDDIIQKSIYINNRNLDDDLLEKLKKNNKFISNELTNNILPLVDKKC